MTIDSKFTVRAANSKKQTFHQPPNIVSIIRGSIQPDYDERLFFCPERNQAGIFGAPFYLKNQVQGISESPEIPGNRSFELDFEHEPRLDKKLRKCLALKGKFYYNNVLYVVGPWLMQGVAKLRKVAEVFITDFNYLKLPHLTNSNRTIVAK
jgi:hypothetical protein